MSITGSAIDAMNVLCAQIEERLQHNEDFRALKALQRAIAEVQASTSVRIASVSSVLPGAAEPQPSPMSHHGLMQQKIADAFGGTVAA